MAAGVSTTVLVVGLTIVVCVVVWLVGVSVLGLSKQASTAVLNAGGYISRPHDKDEPRGRAFLFVPEDDVYARSAVARPRPGPHFL